MKLQELHESRTLHQLVALVDRITDGTLTSFRDIKQIKYDTRYLDKVKAEYPQFIYQGPMFRTVSVLGLTPATLDQIKSNTMATGLQSFSKTKEGMEHWLEYVYDTIDENMADTTLSQSGIGIDVSAIYAHAQNNPEEFKKAMFNLERAAEVEEVIAPYYPNVKVIGTQVWDMDEEDEDF